MTLGSPVLLEGVENITTELACGLLPALSKQVSLASGTVQDRWMCTAYAYVAVPSMQALVAVSCYSKHCF